MSTDTHDVLLTGPANPFKTRFAVTPGRAAPPMTHGVLTPCLYHALWHDSTEGAAVYMLSGLFWYLVGCYLSAIYHNHVLLTLALYYCTIVSLLISSILVLNGEIIMLDLLFLTAPMLY